jgi:hypothetical protein
LRSTTAEGLVADYAGKILEATPYAIAGLACFRGEEVQGALKIPEVDG